jgi:hypothetical protein
MKISGNLIVISSSGGAILGGSIFGPAGALIGAVTGATFALISSNQEDGPDNGDKSDERSSSTTKLQDPEVYAR